MSCVFFFQAEDGIRDLVRSRGLGDVYKRQTLQPASKNYLVASRPIPAVPPVINIVLFFNSILFLSLIHI